jgi:hypothetical protein
MIDILGLVDAKRTRISSKEALQIAEEKEKMLMKSRGGLSGDYWVNLEANKRRSTHHNRDSGDFDTERPKKRVRTKDIFEFYRPNSRGIN